MAMRAAPILTIAVPGVIQAAPALACTRAGRWLFPALTRIPDAHAVALTFDDGPDASLDLFLSALNRAGARATFFLVAEQVRRYPHAPREIIAAGHEVAVHGFTHRGHLRRWPWDVAEDLRRARATIEDAAGCETRLYRPPYGLFSAGSWFEAGRQGWHRVLWNRWGKDWEATATPQRIAAEIGYPRAGDILLLHDSDRYSAPGSWRNTLAALPLIFDRLARAGLQARTVSELLHSARS
jgi:peptidoglycan/xylan/chitin deacetylase (PgdA/CDA1 family)